MEKELSPQNIVYKFLVNDIKVNKKNCIPEYNDVYEKIQQSIDIKNEGFNIYLIDEFSKNKLDNLKKFISNNMENRKEPDDICYIINDNENRPQSIKLSNGKGKILKEILEKLQDRYVKLTYEFYNDEGIEDKQQILKTLKEIKNKMVSNFIETAKEKDLDIKFSQYGFNFVPIKDGKGMSEEEYDDLPLKEKNEILSKIDKVKQTSRELLTKLEELEKVAIDKVKIYMQNYYQDKFKDLKEEYKNIFKESTRVANFLDYIDENIKKSIIDNYSLSYDKDEEEIKKIIYKYSVNVLVDNSNNKEAPIIFEDDPNIDNLLGCIEYESKNGNYTTDLKDIKAGDLLKANGGYLILRANNLLENPLSYYYLKKSLMSGEVDYNHSSKYLDLISLNGLSPKPVKFEEKIIIIGDYRTYDILYNYDEDFKKLFKIKAQCDPIVKMNDKNINILVQEVLEICEDNSIKLDDIKDIKEIARFLSRKCEDKRKLYFDQEEINKLLIVSNQNSKLNKRKTIQKQDILDAIYKKDIVEKQIYEEYKDKRILIDVTNKCIGQVNGLAVIDSGYFSFGKPLKITCTCYKGEGNIIGVEKENDMSGNIHNKSISILKGCINNQIGLYSKLPVDFHICFEQLYGKIEGDSASVAEFIAMISALSKIPIKQNIAVTGSINQFGVVQPIGGVNQKIEGFYNVCKTIDSVEEKGVLIPESNKENIVLSEELEKAIQSNKFHIYIMKNIEDAIEVLMCDRKDSYTKVMDALNKELKKYKK